SRAAQVDVEPGLGRRHLDIERLADAFERLRDRPGSFDRAGERRRQDRAPVDRHDVVSARRRETDLEDIALTTPRMEDRAAAAITMRVDQAVNRRVESGPRQRLDDEITCPFAIMHCRPVLQRAAAAGAEMRTDRRDAVWARDLDADEVTAVGMAGPGVDRGGFARQRIGHIDRPDWRLGDAVAALAETRNLQMFNHGVLTMQG